MSNHCDLRESSFVSYSAKNGKLMTLAAKSGIDIYGPLPEASDDFGG